MKIKFAVPLIIALSIVFSGMCFASGGGGAGGIFYGFQSSNSLISELPLPEESSDLTYFGGYGYGVFSNGYILGGFGMALLGNSIWSDHYGVAGGFGGLITGLRLIDSMLQVNIMLWLGLGGLGVTNSPDMIDGEGYFAAYAEAEIEAGLTVTPWMAIFIYAGYQIIGNVIPGPAFQGFRNVTPVFGIRLCWGAF